ncbi:hypothetical protein TELCIR_10581 [Teladorsagia circumcincta]|uniref:Uncharacterized protein n=1 Tax=Teladorsagia circumcincta TaxID=45464 RepID=A0A2G9UBR4_TELCI|nr:hypothetical protein TELCIR_10581 [Teladorsagia circumcincta]
MFASNKKCKEDDEDSGFRSRVNSGYGTGPTYGQQLFQPFESSASSYATYVIRYIDFRRAAAVFYNPSECRTRW